MSGLLDTISAHDPVLGRHLLNVAQNLQLVADLGYGDVALAVPGADGALAVAADARPVTAVAALAGSRVGANLSPERESEAYEAARLGRLVQGTRRRITRGISYTSAAYPVGPAGDPAAVIVRNVALQVLDAPGAMETQFMQAAEDLLKVLCVAPLTTAGGDTFSTVRVAGDGVLRLDTDGRVAYASPNAVNIMRLAGFEGAVPGTVGTRLPGGPAALAPVMQGRSGTAAGTETEVGERVLDYRAIRLEHGVLVLVQDRTEAYRREQEIKVKEATIREVHHRVKNNLQTIASLLRIQARRAETDEARRELAEAVERVSSMAVVHDMLASSTEERIDFTEAARTVVDQVRRGLAGESKAVSVSVNGSTGLVPSYVATSLALIVAELVHNAIEHGFADRDGGEVEVAMRRLIGELVLTVRDDGTGLPQGFDPHSATNLGLAIVRTVVEDNLHGTIAFSGGRGTTVTVRFPLADDPTPGKE
ncbi:MAG: histidine kinase N-terminal domain-containing protein [Anaerosomatales bacterium]|nr:histidine kinase N-terminal domain-containing protein [Anaerosomatales bacterium]MDT8434479.1 histidine kinase N-terminal domain-containing protein [Anaerosomatales bacterium]